MKRFLFGLVPLFWTSVVFAAPVSCPAAVAVARHIAAVEAHIAAMPETEPAVQTAQRQRVVLLRQELARVQTACRVAAEEQNK